MTPRLQNLSQGRLMFIVGLLVAAFVLFFPARQLVQQRNEMEHLRGRLADLSKENERLAEEVARLDDPAELEALARERLGLVKPGEDAYYFVEQPDPEPSAPPGAPEGRSVFSRAWGWVVDLFRGSG